LPEKPLVVAVDGPAGAGKSAVGRRVAAALQVPFVDSGLFYRAVAWLALEEGVRSDDFAGLAAIATRPGVRVDRERVFDGDRDLTGDIHRPEINENLSVISQVPDLRDAINERQRRLATAGGVVMAGRDIGTVVFPDADYKFFLTAALEERVRRRLAQKARRGEKVGAEEMEREIVERDVADSTRRVAPLKPAADSIVVDTTGLDLDQVVHLLVKRIRG